MIKIVKIFIKMENLQWIYKTITVTLPPFLCRNAKEYQEAKIIIPLMNSTLALHESSTYNFNNHNPMMILLCNSRGIAS